MIEWTVRILKALMWIAALVVAAVLYAVFSPLLIADWLSGRKRKDIGYGD